MMMHDDVCTEERTTITHKKKKYHRHVVIVVNNNNTSLHKIYLFIIVVMIIQSLTRRVITSTHFQRTFQYSTTLAMGRKAGVASPEELKKFVEEAGERLMVIDGTYHDVVGFLKKK